MKTNKPFRLGFYWLWMIFFMVGLMAASAALASGTQNFSPNPLSHQGRHS